MKILRPLALAAVLIFPLAELAAQQLPQSSSPFARNRNSKEPINIESDSLELRDKDKTATFINNVKLVQGDMTVECKVLVVHYDDPTPAGTAGVQKTRASGPGGSRDQQIKRMEASGGVVVTQKDQVATGDSGVFDMKSNTATIIGNVVLTQGQNVVRGDRLWVDLNTNLSRVESKKTGDGRVQGLFLPRDQNKTPDAAPAPASAPAALPPATRPTSRAPAATTPDKTRNASSDKDTKPKPPARPLRLN